MSVDLSKEIEQTKRWIDLLKEAGKSINTLVDSVNKKAQVVSPQESKSIAELTKKIALLEEQLKKKKRTQDETARLQEKLDKLRKGELDQTIKLREEIKKENAERRNQAKSILETTNAYKKLTKETNEAQAEFKRLAAEFGVTSKQAQGALNKFNKLDDSLRLINDAARDGRRDVGRYGIATEGLGRNLASLGGNLLGAFGIVGGITAFANVLKDSINIIRNFDSAQSELAGILGTNKDAISDIRDLTIQLGSSTSFSATEVTKASTELAKLGFVGDEIKNSLKGVLDGAVAFGVGIDESASLAVKTLNAFQLSAKDSERVVSTLAVAGTKSALDFQFLGDSLPYAATGARILGQTVEETTAQLGILADNGIKASTAGTSLRKIFSELSKNGLDMKTVFNDINTATNKSAVATQYFGAQAKDAAIVLAENVEQTESLTRAITNQEAALSSLVEGRLDNLDGDLDKLNSAWEGLILSIDNGTSALTGFLRGITQVATSILGFLSGNKQVSDSLREQKTEFNTLTNAITSNNVTAESRLRLLNKLQQSYPEYLKNVNIDKVSNEELLEIMEKVNDSFENKIRLQLEQEKQLELQERLKKAIKEEDELLLKIERTESKIQSIRDSGRGSAGRDVKILKEQERSLEKVRALQDEINKELNQSIINQKDLNDESEKGSEQTAKDTDLSKEQEKREREITGAIEKQSKLIAELNKDKERANEKDIAAITKRIEKEEEELKRLKDLGKTQKQNSLDVDFKNVTDEINTNAKEQELIILEGTDNINEIREQSLINEIDRLERLKLAYKDFGENTTEIDKNIIKTNQELNQQKFENAVSDIEKENKEKTKALLQSGKKEEEILEESFNNEIQRLDDLIAAYDKFGKDTIDLEIEKQNKINAEKERADAEDLERRKKNQEAIIELGEQLVDKAIDQSRRISEQKQKELEDEISNAQDRQKELFNIANSGTSEASQIAAQAIEEEAQREREKTEELRKEKNKQVTLEATLTGLKVLGAQAGQPNALPKTLADVAGLLTGIIGLIPSFEVGTEMTDSTGRGVDGKGGFHAILHDKERVMDKENNLKTVGLSNTELADVGQAYLKGELVNKQTIVPQQQIEVKRFQSNEELIQEFRKLRNAFENQEYPEHIFDYDPMLKAIEHREVRKGKIRRNFTKI